MGLGAADLSDDDRHRVGDDRAGQHTDELHEEKAGEDGEDVAVLLLCRLGLLGSHPPISSFRGQIPVPLFHFSPCITQLLNIPLCIAEGYELRWRFS